MPPLADLQRAFARSLMTGGPVPAAITGSLRPDEAMRIHRNTVMGALVGALRLTYPTLDALVGEAFFDQAACAFAEARPPRTAALSGYGDGFAEFLGDFAPCTHLPYLADVARLDLAMDRALLAADGMRNFPLDTSVTMTLPRSVTVLTLNYPADEIRAAIGDDAALAAVTLELRERHVLVWRQQEHVRFQSLGLAAGRFLQALLAGSSAQDALAATGSDPAAFAQLQEQIFTAPFCTIISNPEGIAS